MVCTNGQRLLLAFLDILREPLETLEQTLTGRCATRIGGVRGSAHAQQLKTDLTLDAHTTTDPAFCADPISLLLPQAT